MSDLEGERLRERYEPLEVIGRGGQGEVLKARDHFHDRLVAIKVRDMPAPEDRDAFLQEARVLLNLEPHPGSPIVRDDFFEGDRYYLVMDWVEGTDLETLLRRRGDPGLPYAIVLDYVEQVAETLDHLHAHDPLVVHQDVKPANLILTPKQKVVLVDFGIAGSSARSSIMGTPHYVAPEILAGEQPTAAADVFGLAATTFALLTGAPPRGDATEWEDVPRENLEIVKHALGRGLATDPLARPGSAKELVERLRARLEVGTTAQLDRREPMPDGRSHRRARLVGSLVVAALAVVGVLVAWVVVDRDAPTVPTVPVNSVARIDLDGGTVAAEVSVGRNPVALVASHDSIWVANLSSKTVTRIDADTGEVLGTPGLSGAPTDIAANSDGVWVANELQGTVERIDPSTGDAAATLRVPVGSKSIAADDGAIWLTNTFDNSLARIDPRTHTLISTIALPGMPADVALGFDSVWVSIPENRSLLRIDPESNDVLSIGLRGRADQIAIGADAVWVSSPSTNQVFHVLPAERTSTAVDVGSRPLGIDVHDDAVWVANYEDGSVSRIDASEVRVTDTIHIGNAVEAIVATPNGAWVSVHVR